jgi:hypothetical protein
MAQVFLEHLPGMDCIAGRTSGHDSVVYQKPKAQ